MSARGPQFPVFLEELREEKVIQLELLTFRAATYYISLPTGVFTPRVLFSGTVASIIPLNPEQDDEEVPVFLRDSPGDSETDEGDDERTEMEDIRLPQDASNRAQTSTHVLHIFGLLPGSCIMTVAPDSVRELQVGQRILVYAKVFDPNESKEFLDVFLRLESFRILTRREYQSELALTLEAFNERLRIFQESSSGTLDHYQNRNNYTLNMFNIIENNLVPWSSERMLEFRDRISNEIRQI